MGKQKLKAYLKKLDREALEEQLLELYLSSKDVKKYYDFLLLPDETKIVDEWKTRISKEYFPTRGKRIKARRSIGQKAVKEMMFLGLTPPAIADVQLFAIEIAVLYTKEFGRSNHAFFQSFEKQYAKSLDYLKQNGILSDFKIRCRQIKDSVFDSGWENEGEFAKIYANYYLKKQQ